MFRERHCKDDPHFLLRSFCCRHWLKPESSAGRSRRFRAITCYQEIQNSNSATSPVVRLVPLTSAIDLVDTATRSHSPRRSPKDSDLRITRMKNYHQDYGRCQEIISEVLLIVRRVSDDGYMETLSSTKQDVSFEGRYLRMKSLPRGHLLITIQIRIIPKFSICMLLLLRIHDHCNSLGGGEAPLLSPRRLVPWVPSPRHLASGLLGRLWRPLHVQARYQRCFCMPGLRVVAGDSLWPPLY